MRRILVTVVLALSVAGCGDSGVSDSVGSEAVSSGTTTTAVPTFRILSKEDLTNALLRLQDLPAGYSQDPPTSEVSGKTFCDYVAPFQESIRVRQDFTKGSGLSAELLSVGLRQYADADQARASFEALEKALASCTGETYNGVEQTYALMSAPKVGEGSVGVKITAGGNGLLQFFAVVGPVLINTGGGGVMNANADEVMNLLEGQVDKYRASANA
jgi:hypothetical protein